MLFIYKYVHFFQVRTFYMMLYHVSYIHLWKFHLWKSYSGLLFWVNLDGPSCSGPSRQQANVTSSKTQKQQGKWFDRTQLSLTDPDRNLVDWLVGIDCPSIGLREESELGRKCPMGRDLAKSCCLVCGCLPCHEQLGVGHESKAKAAVSI